VPVEEGHLELPLRVPFAIEPDALKTDEHRIHDGAGKREHLRLSLEDLELFVGKEVAHLLGHPFHAFELSHEISPL